MTEVHYLARSQSKLPTLLLGTMITNELVRIVLLYCGLCFVDASVKFRNNGYEDIVVSIGEEIKEDERIINNIKKMFEDGSEVLHTATKQHTFFRQVNIVIPHTWSTKEEYENATYDDLTAYSDIVVDKASPVYGRNPYTLQHGECGEPGRFIHLTPDYLVHMYEPEGVDRHGQPGKVLVHEWAHLRWGVFDEYGDNSTRNPGFYIGEDLQVHVTGCTAEIEGWLRTRDGGNCSANSFGKPDSKCVFFPAENPEIRGSLMNMHFLESVDSFCDDHEVPHNPWAPNRHNVMCQGKSVWAVIREHSDFRNFNSTHASRSRTQRTPTRENLRPSFRLLQVRKSPTHPKFVLLLDLSASMDAHINDLWQSSVLFVRDFLPAESLLSVISFSNTSKIDVNFTHIDERNRMSIVDSLPKDYHRNGQTGIGAALKFTLETAEKEGIPTRGLNIILITDGEETVYPKVETVMPSIKRAGLVLDTFAYGSNVTDKIEDWAADTGGRSYYHNADDSESISRFYFLLYDSITQDTSETKFLQITSRSHFLGKILVDKVDIDSKVGLETRFIFMEKIHSRPENPFSLEVELRGPGPNLMFNGSSDGCYINNDTRTIIISVPDAQAGVWTYTLRNTHMYADNVYVDVLTKPRPSKEEPIRVNSWVSTDTLSFPAKMRVYARVTRGYHPVVRAYVTAVVEPSFPSSKRIILFLRDDGVEGDMLKGDGIYTAVFTEFTGNGRYGVSVSVAATNTTSILMGRSDMHILREKVSSSLQRPRLPLPVEEMPDPSTEFLPADLLPPDEEAQDDNDNDLPSPSTPPSVDPDLELAVPEPFMRVSSGTYFKVTDFRPGDFQPPARIMDLSVIGLSLRHATVTLGWTSPGDDYYSGTASAIHLRFHTTTSIYTNFEKKGHAVTEDYLLEGSLEPKPGRERHIVKIKLLGHKEEDLEGRVVYFAVKAVDDEGNESEICNVASAYFPLAKYVRSRQLTETEKINAVTGLVVLVVLAITIIVIVAFVVTVKVMHARRRQKDEQHSMA